MKPRPFLVMHAIRGGTRYLKFDSKLEAVQYYCQIEQAKRDQKDRVTIGWPQLFSLRGVTEDDRTEVALHSL